MSILLGALCLGLPQGASAQEDYRFDAGGGIGMTGYLGDANTANLWSHPGVDGMLLFRYIKSPRIAFKTGFYVGTLSGNSADMTDVLPDGAQFKFSTTFFELSEMFEFNFFNYGIGGALPEAEALEPLYHRRVGRDGVDYRRLYRSGVHDSIRHRRQIQDQRATQPGA